MNEEKWLRLFEEALQEDAGNGDHSTLSCIPADLTGKAILKIKEPGILAGLEAARMLFAWKEPTSVFTAYKKDGEPMQPGEIAFEVTAHIHTILLCERLALNCMQRMSGIATLTRQYTDVLQGFKTKLLDTRKTTPNFRVAEKEAVRIGGGLNHRFGLYDMIMLKDNHIDYCGGIEAAVNKANDYVHAYQPHLKIEVEARNMQDVETLCRMAHGKIFRIMLDNFTPADIVTALQLIDGRFETEASGGINLQNIKDYAATGVDYISVGGLIHQARSLDLSLKASF